MSEPNDGLVDKFTSIDERVARTNKLLKKVVNNLGEGEGDKVGSSTRHNKNAYVYAFDRSVPSNTGRDDPDRVTRRISNDVRTLRFIVGWPSGANDLVGVKLQETGGGRKFFPANPEDEYTSNDNVTVDYTLEFDIEGGTEVEVVYINNDSTNSHFMNAQLEMREV